MTTSTNTQTQKNQPLTSQNGWRKAVMMMAVCFAATVPEIALAAPWDGPLQNLIDLLTGTTARLVAILALIVLGLMAMTGRMSWAIAGSIIGGIVLVFGAAWIADNFIGAV